VGHNIDAMLKEIQASEHNVVAIQAHRLLASLEFGDDQIPWDETKRFRLFDNLLKVALAYAVEAEKLDGDAAIEKLEYASIAKCALEIVSGNTPFDQEIIEAEANIVQSEETRAADA
jgi:hypothetical protein